MHLSLPKRFPLFILASSVCWSLQCLISTLTQGVEVVTYLGSLVQSCCGEGGILQANITGMCGERAQCLGGPGFAPAHTVCAFPIYTAQAPGCSEGNCLRRALGCVHFPGLSCSGSGSRVLHRGTDLAGPASVPLPGPRSSGDQVLGEHSHPHLGAASYRLPVPAAWFSGCTTGAPSQVCCVSLLES